MIFFKVNDSLKGGEAIASPFLGLKQNFIAY